MNSASIEESRRSLAVVVLAAGLGTRMKSKTPKVLHEICGWPMISWVNKAVEEVEPDRTLVVLGSGVESIHQFLPQNTEVVKQQEQLGTGDAVRACKEALKDFAGDILVMYGDTPLITGEELKELLASHEEQEPACTLMSVELDNPTHYGRVSRDNGGHVVSIVEEKDADDQEKLIREVNAGVYVFEASSLWKSLAEVGDDNAQGEVYLTDVIEIMASEGEMVLAHPIEDESVILGVNSRVELAEAAGMMRLRILNQHMVAGVTVVDPATTYVDADVRIGRDSILEPMTALAGKTTVGEDCVIGPSSTVIDSDIDDGVSLIASHVTGARIGSGCQVGPFTYLRSGARLEAGAKAGTFVEIKNSIVGEGTKVPHLSYIGDAEIGSHTNIGAGNITANYDGFNKHRTKIGNGVHTGADTVFVAPLSVGDRAMTGAGSVITGDVLEGDLGIGRARQKNIKGYADKKLEEKGKKKS